MTDKSRLIEVTFPLKQASLDSVHEKNVRHGHISTLHIWPARRPLAASRAALIATLLPDPGNVEERNKILEKLGGRVKPTTKKKKMPNGKVEEIKAEETVGGILHWGRENGPDLDWFRKEIRKAYDGRAPKVLDPFAGGGAIPLEAMRLGCEVTAIDINPVAWFILKCTLEYPQKLAGKKLRLPDFILRDRQFMEDYFEKGPGLKAGAVKRRLRQHFDEAEHEPDFHGINKSSTANGDDLNADIAWHVRAWGKWVLKRARKDLAEFYPTYATWEPVLETEKGRLPKDWLAKWKEERVAEIEAKGLKLCPLTADGEADEERLNEEFDPKYLGEPTNPRWVPKPTVAYLWARTVRNKHHPETTIPLLKTRWLCKKDEKRVLLTMTPKADSTGVEFGIENDVPKVGGNTAQRREHDRRISAGTMSRSGATCPVHKNIMTLEDIRLEGRAGRLGVTMTAVVVEGQAGKEYRLPTGLEVHRAADAQPAGVDGVSVNSRFQPASTRSISCHIYGVTSFRDLFTHRQLLALERFVRILQVLETNSALGGYQSLWSEAVRSYLALSFDRLLAFTCVNVRWKTDAEAVVDAFSRFSISLLWDFAEPDPTGGYAGAWSLCYERIATALDSCANLPAASEPIVVLNDSADGFMLEEKFDVIITDPPYYEAVSYADLSDFFYVWLRSLVPDRRPFATEQTSKEREIVQHIREDKRRDLEKLKYEQKMAEAFRRCRGALSDDGRFVCVFAHKDPLAWETLVVAIIQAGFVVAGSWPIQTEMPSRQRAAATASLASSVWLVCKKRPAATRPGWDNIVLQQMRERISGRLREFWDAGIRGPDFVWAATGPALEGYSQHPVVKKANKPNELMSVSEFLRHVRRMVLDFVVGRVLSKAMGGGEASTEELDDVTTYYLLHRNDFKMQEAPAGACILYAVSCNLSDRDLVDSFDLLVPSGGRSEDEEEGETADDGEEMAEGSSSTFKLKQWNKRKRQGMGYDPVVDSPSAQREAAQGTLFVGGASEKPRTRIIPLIDQIHRLMHLWNAGDVVKVNDYLSAKSLRTNALFPAVLQALIEMAEIGSEERSILESLSNHVQGHGVRAAYTPELAPVSSSESN
jgi:adenine-specific DNA methylase